MAETPEKEAEPTLEDLQAQFKAEFEKGLDERSTAKLEAIEREFNAKAEALLEDLQKKANRFSVPGTGDADNQKRPFSMSKAIGHMIGCVSADEAGFEIEACKAAREQYIKVMGTVPDSAGGFIVPAQIMADQIIPLMQQTVIAMELGATMLPLTGIPAKIPKVTGGSTAYWVTEGTSVTASDLTLGELALTPKRVACRTILNDQLIANSSPAADMLVRNQMADDLGNAWDAAIFVGSGASGQPIGIINETGINTVTGTGTVRTYAQYLELIEMESTLAIDHTLRGNLGWAIHPTALYVLRGMKSEDAGGSTATTRTKAGSGSVNPVSFENGKPMSIIGYPFRTSTNLTSTRPILGAWQDLILGQWGTMIVRSSNTTSDAMEKFQTHVVTAMDVDVGLRNPESFCVNASFSVT